MIGATAHFFIKQLLETVKIEMVDNSVDYADHLHLEVVSKI